jgi:hypothetical protein
METQAAADLIAEFATDPTYESFPSLRAMMAVQVKNKLGELTPEQKAAIWALLPPEQQQAFKESLAIHDAIDERMYLSVDELPTKSKKNDDPTQRITNPFLDCQDPP